jgi:hypothetical protein
MEDSKPQVLGTWFQTTVKNDYQITADIFIVDNKFSLKAYTQSVILAITF